MSDDPFADLPEADRTVIRPRPGGRAAGPAERAEWLDLRPAEEFPVLESLVVRHPALEGGGAVYQWEPRAAQYAPQGLQQPAVS